MGRALCASAGARFATASVRWTHGSTSVGRSEPHASFRSRASRCTVVGIRGVRSVSAISTNACSPIPKVSRVGDSEPTPQPAALRPFQYQTRRRRNSLSAVREEASPPDSSRGTHLPRVPHGHPHVHEGRRSQRTLSQRHRYAFQRGSHSQAEGRKSPVIAQVEKVVRAQIYREGVLKEGPGREAQAVRRMTAEQADQRRGAGGGSSSVQAGWQSGVQAQGATGGGAISGPLRSLGTG